MAADATERNHEAGERYGLLRVVMERDYNAFGPVEREGFLSELANLLALDRASLRDATFDRGCVHARIKIPEDDLEAFLALYQHALEAEDSTTLNRLRAFLIKHNVANITGDFSVPLQIRVTKPAIDAPPDTQEIIFVHGFTGDKETFGELPRYLSESFYCRSSIFEYPTNWRKHSPSIYFLAKSFDRWFRNHVQSRRVALIAHSMGGVLVRKFITLQGYHPRRLDGYVKQVSFIASPFDGSPLASFGSALGLGGEQLGELSPGSAFVAELKEAWLSWTGEHVPKDCHVSSLYGTADKIVTPVNAMGTTLGAEAIAGEDHTSIVKPTSVGSEIVITLKRYLRDEAGFMQSSPTTSSSSETTQP
jgi:hypothetical protein